MFPFWGHRGHQNRITGQQPDNPGGAAHPARADHSDDQVEAGQELGRQSQADSDMLELISKDTSTSSWSAVSARQILWQIKLLGGGLPGYVVSNRKAATLVVSGFAVYSLLAAGAWAFENNKNTEELACKIAKELNGNGVSYRATQVKSDLLYLGYSKTIVDYFLKANIEQLCPPSLRPWQRVW